MSETYERQLQTDKENRKWAYMFRHILTNNFFCSANMPHFITKTKTTIGEDF